MARRLLDTNWLINHWRDSLKGGLANKTPCPTRSAGRQGA